jgi:hypothetical protein
MSVSLSCGDAGCPNWFDMHTTVLPPECYCPCHVLAACHRNDRAVPFAHRLDNQGLLNPAQEVHTVCTMVHGSQLLWFVQAT